MGKAAAITRRDSSATLSPRVRGEIFASCERAHAGATLLGRWMSSFLAIVLTGKARDVLVKTICVFGAIWQIQETACPRASIEGGSFVMSLFTSHKDNL